MRAYWLSPLAFPAVLGWVPADSHCSGKAVCSDHGVEFCSACTVLTQIACILGNYYWCSQLFTNVAAAVICALIFFSKPIYFVSAVLKCSGGLPSGRCLWTRVQDGSPGDGSRDTWCGSPMRCPGPCWQGFSYLPDLLLLLWFSHVSITDNPTNRTF